METGNIVNGDQLLDTILNDNINNTVFIYHKAGKIKALDLKQAKPLHEKMIVEGWVHTQSLNACVWIEYLFNQAEPEDIIAEIRELAIRIK
jgi:hypothetical protein